MDNNPLIFIDNLMKLFNSFIILKLDNYESSLYYENPDYLLVISNDSWFTDSAAVYMHNNQSKFRAIENGRYLVRSANTGVSSVINDRGEVLESLAPLKTGYVLEEVHLSDRVTVYSVIGNVFACACIALCAAAILYPICERIVNSIVIKRKTERN